VPLDNLVNWNNIYDWARQVWTHDGKIWGMPQEAYTVELYYNKDTLAKLGVALPPTPSSRSPSFSTGEEGAAAG
jgi:multiple sugar transport system substrate-binding protein